MRVKVLPKRLRGPTCRLMEDVQASSPQSTVSDLVENDVCDPERDKGAVGDQEGKIISNPTCNVMGDTEIPTARKRRKAQAPLYVADLCEMIQESIQDASLFTAEPFMLGDGTADSCFKAICPTRSELYSMKFSRILFPSLRDASSRWKDVSLRF
jgi:hypothetical protein